MSNIHPDLERMDTADPKADVEKAIKDRDFRFVGVCGIGFWCPEADDREETLGSKAIEGTSDFYCSDREHYLNIKACEYAKAYNKLLIKKLDKLGL